MSDTVDGRPTLPSDSAKRRAERKLLAEGYKYLPSRETLQAATQLEQAKIERATRESQLALQTGSLAVAVLHQVPRDVEDNKRVFAAARDLLVDILERALVQLRATQADEEFEADADEELT